MIDLHSHVLSGIDDGPDSIEGSLALARAAAAAGTSTLVATPHVSWRYPNDSDTIARLVAELNARLGQEHIALDVLAGGEIAMTRLPGHRACTSCRGSGYGGGRWLLVEPPFVPAITGLERSCWNCRSAATVCCSPIQSAVPRFIAIRAMLEGLVRGGVITSLTAGSLVGRFGESVRRFALQLVRDGMAHNVASDAHDHTRRPPGMAAELEHAGLTPLADWLTRGVPAAILEDLEIPRARSATMR